MNTSLRRNWSPIGTAGRAAIVAAWLAVPVPAGQPDAPPPSYEGILVLQNGNLLRGTITQADDRYHVVVDGGQIHVPPRDVMFTCRTLEEAYAERRARIQPGVARDHLELAQWCQRHGLLAFAAEQLAHATAVEPNHPMIPLVEQRIQTSLPETQDPPRPGPPAKAPPSPEELDRLVRGMPPGSVETFTQTMQPLLVNNCAQAGCHGPGSESRYRLLRPSRGKPAGRRLTQRNLQSTLEWVDRDNPDASRLLNAPIEAHGSDDGPIFRDHEADQYQRLVDWVYHVAQKSPPPRTIPHEADPLNPSEGPAQSAVQSAVHTTSGPTGRGGAFQVAPGVVPPNVPLASQRLKLGSVRLGQDAWPTPKGSKRAPRAAPQPLPSADPFDPEVFNRRFYPEKQGEKDRLKVEGSGLMGQG